MKVNTKFTIEVNEILEVPKGKEELVLKAIKEKQPLFNDEQRKGIINSLAFELDADKETINIVNECYELVEK